MKKIPIRSDDEDEKEELREQTESTSQESAAKPVRKINVHEPKESPTEETPGEQTDKNQEPASDKERVSSIEIKISFPSLSRLGKNLKRIPKKIYIPLLVLLIIGISFLLLQDYVFNDTEGAAQETALQDLTPDVGSLPRGTPKFSTVTPGGQTIEGQDWTRISPEGSDPVYAYTDRVEGVKIAVSQQPLPDEFKKDTAMRIEQMAAEFGATEKITVSDVTVHIGTSGNGPQSVLFTKQGLLVLIKSTDTIPNDAWLRYISSLR